MATLKLRSRQMRAERGAPHTVKQAIKTVRQAGGFGVESIPTCFLSLLASSEKPRHEVVVTLDVRLIFSLPWIWSTVLLGCRRSSHSLKNHCLVHSLYNMGVVVTLDVRLIFFLLPWL